MIDESSEKKVVDLKPDEVKTIYMANDTGWTRSEDEAEPLTFSNLASQYAKTKGLNVDNLSGQFHALREAMPVSDKQLAVVMFAAPENPIVESIKEKMLDNLIPLNTMRKEGVTVKPTDELFVDPVQRNTDVFKLRIKPPAPKK